jgi:hypothetical protein
MRGEGLGVSISPSTHTRAGRNAANLSALIHERHAALAFAAIVPASSSVKVRTVDASSLQSPGRVTPVSEGQL